jgi:hypothetical protein
MEDDGNTATKQRGLRVIRAVITKTSSLIGKKVAEVDFRNIYKVAIVAVQKGGRNVTVSSAVFGSGDIIVLQADDDSPLLKTPPRDFYRQVRETNKNLGTHSRSSSVASFVNMITKTISQTSIEKKLRKEIDSTQVQEVDDLEAQRSDNDIVPQEGDDDSGMFFIGDESLDGNDQSAAKSSVLITDMVRKERGTREALFS